MQSDWWRRCFVRENVKFETFRGKVFGSPGGIRTTTGGLTAGKPQKIDDAPQCGVSRLPIGAAKSIGMRLRRPGRSHFRGDLPSAKPAEQF